MTTRYIPIVEELRLTLAGAEQRLARARQSLADFHLEHNGQVYAPALRSSLEREGHLLELETRQVAKAIADYKEVQVNHRGNLC